MVKLSMGTTHIFVTTLLLIFLFKAEARPEPGDYFKIIIVDEETGRGVPMVELKTTSNIRYYTDSNGIIALNDPGLMDQLVYFHIKSHGYEFPEDGLGYRGKALKVSKGDSVILKIKRINLAERLYRITGQGIYHYSILVGHFVPIRHPVLNGRVTGQDTVIGILYRGKIYWFWGDTNQLSYPLGNFAVSGATSELPDKGGLDPSIGINLTYFVNESGFSKKMCPIPGPGLVWLDWLVTIEEKGRERLFAKYSRIKNLDESYEKGLAVFNDDTETFERYKQWDVNLKEPHVSTHPFRARVESEDYYYFTADYRYGRVRADLKHIVNPSSYEAFTCLVAGNRYDKAAPRLDRDSNGQLIYAWKANTDPINYKRQQELIEAGYISRQEGWLHLQDIESGVSIHTCAASVFWNDFRQRWVMIMEQTNGTSPYGEIWYAEADTDVGPWVYARKIVTHNKYTFYNPTQHPFFDQEDGRLIYFEGTYTNTASDNPDQTPRYDYNQIMYRLALDDPRLFLPVPVYRVNEGNGKSLFLLREEVESREAWDEIEDIPFFALPPDRRREGLIPIFAAMEKSGVRLQLEPPTGRSDTSEPLFYGLPTDFKSFDKEFKSVEERLTGSWRFKAKYSEGGEIPFVLELKLDGEKITGNSLDEMLVITKGRYKERKLELNLVYTVDQSTYSLTGVLNQGKLIGEWKEDDIDMGTWEAERKNGPTGFVQQQLASPATVPLYEYRRRDGGAPFYATEPDLKVETLQRSAEPICRVWRNPMSLLILDYKTKPVPVQGNRD